MSLRIEKEQVPLKITPDGVVRVGGTRVTLDTVIAAFKEGAAAEEIVFRYPSLHLADVYAVLSYYLRRTKEIEDYLNQRQKKTNEVKQQYSSIFESQGIRDRILARMAKAG
ncbi:MAG: DUF433 domain-containing protein [Acidobacteria bacterium]|jgi:uncharacterized protein (DUF433 family)|nr:DUF433 domain-containing protein [Acidobacteriota bacterium]